MDSPPREDADVELPAVAAAAATAAGPSGCPHRPATVHSAASPSAAASPASSERCSDCRVSVDRALLVSQYLREALPPISSPALLVLPSFAPSGQLVLGCDARLPGLPYAQGSCGGKVSGLAARRRVSRLAVQWLRQDRQLQANLMWAVRFNDTDRARQLISMGSDVNEPDALGRTPLHVAASQGYSDMVELLLSLGARPDPQDRRLNTPLHLAVCTSRWAVTQKLLAAGASVWCTNGANMSALQLARGKLNMVLRLKVQGTLDFDKHIEELKAVHDLVKSALGSSAGRTGLATPDTDPASLASVLDQIENLTISAPSLSDVSAELRQMSLTSSGSQEKT
ncbi:ankyrin repeat domain-containing protein 54-like [Pollicipes pollicipes]|uniref:ankyrin repeat domain-containing protein 54-like n=1 Tax=Pollicipes pollicipes TaxID=41117 RepID=UPI001884EB60|nr:ankyrin repeat domain-containing protein 54-like [Pollicipes pollicipes]